MFKICPTTNQKVISIFLVSSSITRLPILFIFIICFPTCILSQSFDIQFSEDFKSQGTSIPKEILKSDASGIYLYTSTFFKYQNKNYFRKINTDLSVEDRIEISVPGEDCSTSRIVNIDGSFYSFGQCIDKENRTIRDIILELSVSGEIVSQKIIDEQSYNKREDNPIQTIMISKDSTKILVVNIFDYDEKKLNFEARFKVLDKNFNIVNQYHFKNEISQRRHDIDKCIVKNDGSIIWTNKIYNRKKGKEEKSGKPDYKLSINKVNLAGELQASDVDMKEYFYGSSMIVVDDNTDKIYFLSLYRSKFKGLSGGVAINIYNDDLEVEVENLKEFTEEEIGTFTKSKKKLGLNKDYYFLDAWINDHGVNFYIEKYKENIYKNSVQYVSETGFALTINDSGQVLRNFHLPKRANLGHPINTGTIRGIVNGREYFIYCDHEDNINKSPSTFDKFKKSKIRIDNAVTIAFFDKNDELQRTQIVGKEKMSLVVEYSKQINENQVLLVFWKINAFSVNYRYGLLTIND